MKIISFEDIKKLNISAQSCYNWVEYMIKNKDTAILPSKISIKPAEGVFCNVMPSIISNEFGNYCGIKTVTRYPDRKPSLKSSIILYNSDTGEELAIMDGTWITLMRTAAVAVHSINLFAKKEYKSIGFIGLGNVSRAILYMLLELNGRKKIMINLHKYHNNEKLFIERFKEYSNIEFSCYNDYNSLVSASDIVVSCVTYANKNFCADEVFKPGVLVIPVHTLGFTNCDLFFNKVFADDYGHVHHFKFFDKFKSFSEVAEVVNKKKPGRENEDERILVYNIGVSIHDINYASNIYNLFKKHDNLLEIDLKEPMEKYWF